MSAQVCPETLTFAAFTCARSCTYIQSCSFSLHRQRKVIHATSALKPQSHGCNVIDTRINASGLPIFNQDPIYFSAVVKRHELSTGEISLCKHRSCAVPGCHELHSSPQSPVIANETKIETHIFGKLAAKSLRSASACSGAS